MKNLSFYAYEIEGLSGYGLFHLLFVILTIIGIAIFSLIAYRYKEKNIKWIVFGFGILFLILEIYKQLWFNLLDEGAEPYVWYQFPFQMCSTPMYVCLISILFNEKIRNYLYSYLAFYSFVAGLSVMIYPGNIFVDNVSISAQSLTWHGSMVVLGCYLIVAKNYGKGIKEFIPGIAVFGILVTLALTMNLTFEYFKNIYNIDATFNMFYISPYYECSLPILVTIQESVGWFIFFLCYIVAVTFGSSFIWLASFGIRKAINHFSNTSVVRSNQTVKA